MTEDMFLGLFYLFSVWHPSSSVHIHRYMPEHFCLILRALQALCMGIIAVISASTVYKLFTALLHTGAIFGIHQYSNKNEPDL